MVTPVNYKNKSIVLISGASKGIGCSIATNLAKQLNQNSIFILLARSEEGLVNTKKKILEINNNFNVKYFKTDFSKPDLKLYESILDEVTSSTDTSDVHYAFCYHNAGHIGTLRKASTLTDLDTWRSYFDLNFNSAVLLNSAFIKKLQPIAKQLVIVNITSLVGRIPFESMAMYGAGKAARELYFKVLAKEEPSCFVLNYSPGPVDTDMFSSVIVEAESENLRREFKSIKEEKALLTPDQTVGKLLGVLEKADYKSGDVVDYFDRIEK